MTLNQQKLFKYLASLGILTETTEHEPVHTVEDNRSLRANLNDRHQAAAHIKNLFLKDKKGKLWLIVAHEHKQIDLKILRHEIGAAHLSFGKPDLLHDVLSVLPGSVTPFALIHDQDHQVNVVIDRVLLESAAINCHPLTNAATTLIATKDLLRFIETLGFQLHILEA